MDEMAVDPMGVIKGVLEFLGLEFTSEDESKVNNNNNNSKELEKKQKSFHFRVIDDMQDSSRVFGENGCSRPTSPAVSAVPWCVRYLFGAPAG